MVLNGAMIVFTKIVFIFEKNSYNPLSLFVNLCMRVKLLSR